MDSRTGAAAIGECDCGSAGCVFVQTVGQVGVNQSFEHLNPITNSLTSFGVTHAARLSKHTNFLNVRDDVDSVTQSGVVGIARCPGQ